MQIPSESIKNMIYLAVGDELLASELVIKIQKANYRVKQFSHLSELETALDQELPVTIIVDMIFNDGEISGVELITHIKDKVKDSSHIIFISEDYNTEFRLATARAGADRYFYKPFEMEKFVQTLNSLKLRHKAEPFRVLLVDDQESILIVKSSELRKSEIQVETLTKPMEIFNVLEKFKPDVIVVDFHMPECSGPELVKLIRQDDNWSLIPILFLSGETNLDSQLKAIKHGGDDFLEKTIPNKKFVSIVLVWASRARKNVQLHNDLKNILRENKYQIETMDQHDIVSSSDVAGRILSVNEKFCEISGYKAKELIGQNHRLLKSDRHSKEFYQNLWQTISDGHVWHGIICNRKKNGDEYWVNSTIVPFLDDKGKPYKYVSARTDITEHVETEQKLILANKIAESANRAKSQFLASMSHELRTPMNAIIGFTNLLQMDPTNLLNEQQLTHVHEVLGASEHLMTLINQVLDLSKIEDGHIALSVEQVMLCEIVVAAIQLVTPLAQGRGIAINLTRNNEQTTFEELINTANVVLADQTRLKQVLLNLLSNAVKYNRENGKITLACDDAENDQLRISVTDTGAGLSQKQLTQLFTPFNRLGAELGEIEGSGIGLVITKKIIECMNGRIGVESEPGVGSTFWIEIPRETNPVLIEQARNKKSHVPLSPLSYIEKRSTDVKTSRTVLYIEDNSANLNLVSELLGRLPELHMLSADEPILGLELAKKYKPDLILLDINLPGMDGFEVFNRLRKREETSDTPIIAISANAMSQDIEEAMNTGFNDYLTKPLDITALLLAVDRELAAKD